jgi:hypothetical protein
LIVNAQRSNLAANHGALPVPKLALRNMLWQKIASSFLL